MPPKKKGGGKKGGKKSAKKEAVTTTIDGVAVADMTKEELEKHLELLRDELEREREERNYFQLERDKVNTFWEITKRQLEEKKAELRNKDREMEESEEKHSIEIKVYKQKVKHLLYEHENQLAELKADNVTAVRLANDEHRSDEGVLRKEQRDLKILAKERELAFQDQIKELKKNHEAECSHLRNDFEREAKEIEAKYERRMRTLRDEMELRRKTELHEIEERKNGQIQQLMRNHEKAFSDIKNYYNDITLNNLALINTLKEQAEEMKKKEERMERQMNEVQTENRKLAEPLQKAKEELSELHRQMANYDKDKQALANTKARLKEVSEQYRNLSWENEVLLQRFQKLQKERDDLYQRFVRAVHEVQEKSGLKNLLLEKKLSAVTDALEKKEAQLNEVLAASNLDPTALTIVTRKLEDVLDSKNAAIKDLQYELARLCKAYNDLLAAFQSRLSQLGVSADDLGFRPLQTAVAPPLGKAPAGLVSAPT